MFLISITNLLIVSINIIVLDNCMSIIKFVYFCNYCIYIYIYIYIACPNQLVYFVSDDRIAMIFHCHNYITSNPNNYTRWRSLWPIKGYSHWLTEEKLTICTGIGRNSTDIKPIENMCTILKDKVAYNQPSSAENLRQSIMEVWDTEIRQEYCEFLVSNMPRRIQAVIDSKGGPTKY